MRKLLSSLSLVGLVVGSFGSALPALAQPVAIDADVIITLVGILEPSGSPRTLIMKTGSDAVQYVVNATNIVITTERNSPIKIWDLGRGPNGVRRVITNNASPLIPTSCIDEGSQLYINTPNDSQVITVAPGDAAVTCTVSNTGSGTTGGGGGGGGVGGGGSSYVPPVSTTTTQPTATTQTQTQTVTIFRDGKLVQVTPEEVAAIKAAEAATTTTSTSTTTTGGTSTSTSTSTTTTTTQGAPAGQRPTPAEATVAYAQQITQITTREAPAINEADTLQEYADSAGINRDTIQEELTINSILPRLNLDLRALLAMARVHMAAVSTATVKPKLTAAAYERIVGFITYGTDTTRAIGAGERGGVLNSYIAAYGKVPSTAAEWSDLLKIASGRFPTEKGTLTAERALINFQRTYGRKPVAKNANDQAAVTIMQYGLLPAKTVKYADGTVKVVSNRDTKKEKVAILIFKKKFGFTPQAATAWNVVRAIGYSGVPVK
ncbi:MAG: hypothetical protein Q8P56_04525 [Candidatus Uhrbacteria bacterium]|nr:hypothetical protein [Candidatus Uhrbacteria bacterium]